MIVISKFDEMNVNKFKHITFGDGHKFLQTNDMWLLIQELDPSVNNLNSEQLVQQAQVVITYFYFYH